MGTHSIMVNFENESESRHKIRYSIFYQTDVSKIISNLKNNRNESSFYVRLGFYLSQYYSTDCKSKNEGSKNKWENM